VILREVRARGGRVVTYSGAGASADLRLLWRAATERGQTLLVSLFGERHEIHAPVAGAFQAENILAAIGVAVATGVDVRAAVRGASVLESVPGRLEQAAVLANGSAVYVDFAHTPDALRNVLLSLRPHVRKGAQLHVLFGCGGERDTKKRPIMGRIAAELADVVLVTDDNPRTESAASIRAQILAAAPSAQDAGEREGAIRTAVAGLAPGDVLVVAGKGHEDYQIIADTTGADASLGATTIDAKPRTRKIPFSDAQLVRQAALQLALVPRDESVLTAA
jgi:UDP-N-acetylmuramoyl-L-alanyl-D-glutamate--2,6-diaminopimelate ligase